jgi:ABC-2 type transport system permease protein
MRDPRKKMKMIRGAIIKGMIAKEFSQLFRDPRMRFMIIAAPIIMLFVFAFAASTDINDVRVIIVDYDHSRLSRSLAERITASKYFTLESETLSQKEADEALQSGKAEVCVQIPVDFSRMINKGKSPAVQILLDATDPNRAMIIFAQLRVITNEFSAQITSNAATVIGTNESGTVMPSPVAIDVVNRAFFNESLESRVFFLPAILSLIIGLVVTMLTSMSIVKEREFGTIDQIAVTPIRPIEFIAGKALPFGIIAMADVTIISLSIIIFFSVPFHGSFLFLLASSAVYTAAMLGISIYISTISSTQQQAMLSTFLFFLPAIMLSGFIFPISSMPLPVRILTYINPIRYFIVIVRGVFLKGTGIISAYYSSH